MNRKRRRAAAKARRRGPQKAHSPTSADGKLQTAWSYHQAGRVAEAKRLYAEILSEEPEHASALHLLGVLKFQQGDARAAIELIGKAISARPDVAKFHSDLAVALRAQGRLEEAVAAYRKALELRPHFAEVHSNLGNALRQQGRLEEAAAAHRKALELRPDFAEAYSNLGNALQQQGRLEAAVAAHRKALELKPDFAEAHRHLGNALWQQGRLEAAVENYKRALKIKPDFAEAHVNLGNALQEQGEGDEAVVQYRRALAIKSDLDAARNNLELALKYQRRPEDAVARCREALAENPDNAEAHLKMGIALWEQGKVGDAVAALRESLRITPDHAAAHYHLGLARQTQGERSEAVECIRRALELDPGDVYVLAAEASILAEDAASGERHWRKNVKRVALHMDQRYHYGILRPVFDAFRQRHISLLTPHVKTLVDFDPDVVIVAESHAALLRSRLARALFVWVRHGLISKNTTCYSAKVSDFACMTSEASRDWYIEHGGCPRRDFWITGYVQMDPLFRNDPLPMTFALPADRRTVLYAPTWNAALSSAPVLGDRLVELIRGGRRDLSIVIKPHPVIAARHPDWMVTWCALAEADADVHLVEDPATDVMPYLKAADLLITDVSSVIFEYLAVDRPIILITNPDRYTASAFDPEGIEWRWRDVGEELYDVEGLPAAVDRALNDPRLGAERRAYYRRQLFGDLTDGRAAERLVEKVSELEL